MLFLLIYTVYRLFRKKDLLMLIPVCAQVFAFVLALLSFLNNVMAEMYIELIYLIFGILPPIAFILLDYREMIAKLKKEGVYRGFIEKAQSKGKRQALLTLSQKGINAQSVFKPIAEIMNEIADLPEELQKNIRKFLNHAHGLIREDNYDEAFYIYDILSKTVGSSPLLYYNFALVCYQGSKYINALEAYKKANRLLEGNLPAQSDINYCIGNTYYMLNNLTNAAKYYEKALEMNSDNMQATENLSLTYVRMGKTQKGVDAFQKHSIDTEIYRNQFVWGLLLHEAGRYQEAEDALNCALNLEPDRLEALEELGKVLMKRNKPEDALEVSIRMLRIDRDNYSGWSAKADAYLKLCRWKDAINSYKEVIRIKPDCYRSYYNMAAALEETGNRKAAIEAYNKAISINPDFSDAYNNLGILLSMSGMQEEALKGYEEGIKGGSKNASLYFNMGMCLFEEGRYKDAAQAYKNALAIKPDEFEVYYYLGAAYTEIRHYNDAIDAYKSALSIKPSDGELYYNLATIYAILGRYDISIENLRRAIEIDKNIREDVIGNNAFFGMRGRTEFKQLIS